MRLTAKQTTMLRFLAENKQANVYLLRENFANPEPTVESLRRRGLVEIPAYGWSLSERGKMVLRLLDERRSCDWCNRRARDGAQVRGSATQVYFCDDHQRVGEESATGAASSIGNKNVAVEVFGARTSNAAMRKAAAA